MMVFVMTLIIPINPPKIAPILGPYKTEAIITGIWTSVGLIE